MPKESTKGRRGWFADSERHAIAGRKEGRARGKKSRSESGVGGGTESASS